jgi:hypothetical protein
MIESLVAVLLVLTILYCARLNKQIGQLKSDEKLMKASIVELVLATEKAERAIGGLKITAKEADDTLGVRLRESEAYCTAMAGHLKAGEDVLNRLRKIAYANKLLAGENTAPKAEPSVRKDDVRTQDPKSVVAAAQALAERAMARVNGRAA